MRVLFSLERIKTYYKNTYLFLIDGDARFDIVIVNSTNLL